MVDNISCYKYIYIYILLSDGRQHLHLLIWLYSFNTELLQLFEWMLYTVLTKCCINFSITNILKYLTLRVMISCRNYPLISIIWPHALELFPIIYHVVWTTWINDSAIQVVDQSSSMIDATGTLPNSSPCWSTLRVGSKCKICLVPVLVTSSHFLVGSPMLHTLVIAHGSGV